FSANPVTLITAVFISMVYFTLQVSKWQILSKVCFGKPLKMDAFVSFYQGMAVGIISPMRSGEIVGRKMYHPDVSLMDISLTTLADKLQNYFINVLMGSLAVLYYLVFIVHISALLTACLVSLLIVSFSLFASLLLSPRTWKTFVKTARGRFTFLGKVIEKLEPLRSINKKTLQRTFLITFVCYTLLMSQYALLIMSYQTGINYFSGVQVGSLMMFVKSIIPALTLVDFGIRELTSMYFAKHLGFSENAGFNAAFMLFVINLVIPSVIGMILFVLKKDNGSKKA
ncbi:MAG: flippase-like domain-containing protein, partial [Ignavibacteriales bacterium]|nr:flippase-like domain-containing protein [Ignavibacteriales bacterium]